MRKGIEFLGKADGAWVPSSVFGSDTRSAGCADGSGTVGAMLVVAEKQEGVVVWSKAEPWTPEKN